MVSTPPKRLGWPDQVRFGEVVVVAIAFPAAAFRVNAVTVKAWPASAQADTCLFDLVAVLYCVPAPARPSIAAIKLFMEASKFMPILTRLGVALVRMLTKTY